MRYQNHLEFNWPATVTVQNREGEQLQFDAGSPCSVEFTITDETEPELLEFLNCCDRDKAPFALWLHAQLHTDDVRYEYSGLLLYWQLHFRPDERCSESAAELPDTVVSLSRLMDGRDNTPIVIDGTQVIIREKYMGCVAKFAPATDPFVTECRFFDVENTQGYRTVWYRRSFADLLFQPYPHVTRGSSGEIDDVDIWTDKAVELRRVS